MGQNFDFNSLYIRKADVLCCYLPKLELIKFFLVTNTNKNLKLTAILILLCVIFHCNLLLE